MMDRIYTGRLHGSSWTLQRGIVLAGAVVAMLLLGVFHGVVSGAVERSSGRSLGAAPMVETSSRVALLP